MSDINLTSKLKQKMAGRSRVRGRYNSSELYAINYGFKSGKLTPEQWLHAPERTVKEMLTMFNGIGGHNQIQSLLDPKYCENKVEFVYKDIVLVAKADYMPPDKLDEVWELKTSEKLMTKMKPWQEHQVKLYTTMFNRPVGVVYQPVSNDEGIYLKDLGRVERDDAWFGKELEQLYAFHLEVENLWKALDKP